MSFQEEKTVTFEEMPKMVALLLDKIDNIETLLASDKSAKNNEDRWMNIDDLREYHPDHPAKPTIYAWINQRLIPYHKKGKKLQFLKSEIDKWLMDGRKKTMEEIQDEAINYSNSKKGGRR